MVELANKLLDTSNHRDELLLKMKDTMLDIESAQKGISEAKTVAEIEINGLQDQMKRLSDENEVMGRTFVTYANERSSLSIQVEAMTKRNKALEDQIQDIKERNEAEEGI